MGHSSSRPAADAEQNDELWVEEEEGNDEEESECDICSEDCASDMELDKEVEVSTEAPEVERELDPFTPRRPLTVAEVDDLVRYGTELCTHTRL